MSDGSTRRAPAHSDRTARSGLATAALVLTGISALALILMIVLDLLGAEGFSSDAESSAAADVTWLCFSAGAVLALVLGIVAWVRARGRGPAADVKAGQTAVGYFVLAVLVTAVAAAVTNS